MSEDPVERRLAAILSADAVGYSRLMADDDEATVRTLQSHRSAIGRLIDTFRGRVVDAPGDNLLAEFPSAAGAVRCALEIQSTLAAENEKLAAERRMPFRIGIHLGDVMVDGAAIYGDGVNVAARLESLASEGGICLSDIVYQQVRRRLDLAARDLGDQKLKNIEGAVRAFAIGGDEGTELAAAPVPWAAATVELAPPDKPSLAVLPFINMNGDPTEEYFSDGLTADIMAELVRIPGLFLIGQDSAFTYKATGARPRDAARELGVRHVLEGAVRKSDRQIRVNAQLVDAESGRHVWAERYDRPLDDVFAVQDEIAGEVVTALDVTLVGGENARVTRKQLRTPQALGTLYKGSELMHRFTREDMREARRLFEEVMRLEPDSPIGPAEVAWTWYFEVERGWSENPSDALDRMADLANQSLQLGDDSGFAHLMLGHMHLMRREHEEALAESDRALEDRPSCQAAWGMKANILNYCGRPEEAVPLARQSLRLSPVAQTFFPEVLATSHYLNGKLEEAMTAANEALVLAPDSLDARILLTACLAETGRLDAAKEAGREILAIDPSFTLARFARSQPYRDKAPLERMVESLWRAGLERGAEDGGGDGEDLATPLAESRRRVAPRPRR